MSRFTKPTVDWVQMEKLVPKEQKAKFLAFKGKSFAYFRRVLANPPEPPAIEWDMYKKLVPVPGLVDDFKAKYSQLKVPYPTDTLSAEIDKQWATIQVEVQKFVAERQKDIDTRNEILRKERDDIAKILKIPPASRAQNEIKRIDSLPKYESITMEDFHDMYPDVALDSVKKPSFWPHDPEEQIGYKEPVVIKKK